MKTFEILAAVSLMALSGYSHAASASKTVQMAQNNDERRIELNEAEKNSIRRELSIKFFPKFLSIYNSFPEDKRGFVAKIRKKNNLDYTESFEKVDVLMTALYPLYKKIRGDKAISDFTVNKRGKTIKAKKRAKYAKKLLLNMRKEIQGKREEIQPYYDINLKKIAKYYEDLGKEVGFKLVD